MREIAVHPSAGEPPVTIYGSSGPYTNPAVEVAIDPGLPRLRSAWIEARGDVEAYEGRNIKSEDNGFVSGDRMTPEFQGRHRPLKAINGKAVTPLAYPRAGIIKPETEHIAIRENIGREARQGNARTGWRKFGAAIPDLVTPELSGDHPGQYQSP
jgi:phosphomethylpyrimidine synthase